jgi:lysophospholipase L1-like esterase
MSEHDAHAASRSRGTARAVRLPALVLSTTLMAIGCARVGTATLPLAVTLGPPSSAVRPLPVSQWTKPWRITRYYELNRAARTSHDVELLFLGDSLVQQWTVTGVRTWNEQFANRHAANFGLAGDRTEHLLWRIEHGNLDGLSPRVVVLMIGTNNCLQNTAEEIADGVGAVVHELRRRLPEADVVIMSIPPRRDTPRYPLKAKLAAADQRIRRLADGRKAHYVDLSERFLDEHGSIRPGLLVDGVHLSTRGYELWADAMEPTLARLLPAEGGEPANAGPRVSSTAPR